MTARTLGRVSVLAAGTVALGYLVLLATVAVRWNGDFAVFLLVVLVGAIVLAGLRFVLREPSRDPVAVADPFARDLFSTDVVNIAHIRVAGLGGAGLVLAAMVAALEYQLTAVAVGLGLVGGLLGALTVIVSRRWRHS